MLICRTKEDVTDVCPTVKYLSRVINDKMMDDDDTRRQRRLSFANTSARRCYSCSDTINILLIKILQLSSEYDTPVD